MIMENTEVRMQSLPGYHQCTSGAGFGYDFIQDPDDKIFRR